MNDVRSGAGLNEVGPNHGADDGAGSALAADSPCRFIVEVATDDARRATEVLVADSHYVTGVDVQSVSDGVTRMVGTSPPALAPLERFRSELVAAGVRAVVRPAETLTDLTEDWLDSQLAGHLKRGEQSRTFNRRLQALAGSAVLESLLSRCRDAGLDWEFRGAAASAAGLVLRNTLDVRLILDALHAAVEIAPAVPTKPAFPRGWAVELLVDAAAHTVESLGVDLDALTDEDRRVAEADIRLLLQHPWVELQWRVLELASRLPGTRERATAEILAEVGLARAPRKGRDAGVVNTAAAQALATCPPLPQVLDALIALTYADQGETRAEAGYALGALAGADVARELWERWLDSSSPVDRDCADALLADYGTESDVPLALDALRRVLKSRARPGWPRGTELLAFLDQHGARSTAAAELERARHRAGGVDPLLERWLAETIPALAAIAD